LSIIRRWAAAVLGQTGNERANGPQHVRFVRQKYIVIRARQCYYLRVSQSRFS
jgi:hypothetical protein